MTLRNPGLMPMDWPGLVFYGSVLAVVVLFMMGKTLPAAWVLAVMFGIPLVIIFLKEPARFTGQETGRKAFRFPGHVLCTGLFRDV